MNSKRVIALVAATLVAGLALGTMTSAWAAGTGTGPVGTTNSVVAGACDLGLRLGTAVRDAGGRLADVVARLTGLTATEVQAKRAAGESFTAIAKSEGIDSSAVVGEALKVRSELLDAQVKAGTITQEQADAALTRMTARLQDRVDSTGAGRAGTGTGAGRGGMRGGRGMGSGAGGLGAGCGACTAAPNTAPAVQ